MIEHGSDFEVGEVGLVLMLTFDQPLLPRRGWSCVNVDVCKIEIRAATVEAVERLKKVLAEKGCTRFYSINLDWYLWQIGEERKDQLLPHHRTLSIYY